MDNTFNDLLEMARMRRRELDKEQTELLVKLTSLEDEIKLIDHMAAIVEENRKLKEESESQRQQLEEKERLLAEKDRQIEEYKRQLEEKDRQIEAKDRQLAEMNKLSAGMAKKSTQDDFEKNLRTYLNISKRKIASKREAAKTVITELLATAKLDVSDDIKELLDHLDDESEKTQIQNYKPQIQQQNNHFPTPQPNQPTNRLLEQ